MTTESSMGVGVGVGVGGRKRSKTHQTMVETPYLPSEIIEEIFTWFPAKPLKQFRCLSKNFHTLLTSTNFAKKHFSRATQHDHDEDLSFICKTKGLNCEFYISNGAFTKAVKLDSPQFIGDYAVQEILLVGSAKGLLCLTLNYGTVIYLWNPFIRKYKKLPPPNSQIKTKLVSDLDRVLAKLKIPFKKRVRRYNPITLGFGFHPTIKEYKLVRCRYVQDYQDDYITSQSEVEVYSLSSNSWKTLGFFPYIPGNKSSSRATLNGVIHWLSRRGCTKPIQMHVVPSFKFYELILAFDMAKDEFFEVPLPEDLATRRILRMNLQVFRRCLSIFSVIKEGAYMWVMKEYCVKESWTHLFKFEKNKVHRSIDFLENGDILLEGKSCSLVSYNPKNCEFNTVSIHGLEEGRRIGVVVPYVESLALLAHDEVADWSTTT